MPIGVSVSVCELIFHVNVKIVKYNNIGRKQLSLFFLFLYLLLFFFVSFSLCRRTYPALLWDLSCLSACPHYHETGLHGNLSLEFLSLIVIHCIHELSSSSSTLPHKWPQLNGHRMIAKSRNRITNLEKTFYYLLMLHV